jgi:hypothetical protein
VFIIVCNNTATSKLVYDYISGFHRVQDDACCHYRHNCGTTRGDHFQAWCDLKEAAEQQAAMEKAKMSLLVATDTAETANAGSRAVSITPELKDGHPTAEVSLLQGNTFKKVAAKLD